MKMKNREKIDEKKTIKELLKRICLDSYSVYRILSVIRCILDV